MNAPAAITLPKLSYGFARQNGVLLTTIDGTLTVIRRTDAGLSACLEARRIAGAPAALSEVSATEFERLLSQIYASGDLSETVATAMDGPDDLMSLAENLPRTSDLLDSDDDAPIIKLINGILQEAIRTRASDIHIEPYENRLAVRFRIDGALRDMLSLSSKLSSTLASRVKVMAQLDIAKKRVPQDGRFSLNLGERAIDVRVSTLPSQYGERVVMRLLEKTAALMNLSDLGMDVGTLAAFKAALAKPNGIVLVTGPTGSGKTTTLYGAVSGLNDGSRNILTVEDPVEYALDGVGQTQVNDKVGMSFAAGLRAILRQDPDIVMIGEIRDPETAEIAVQSALTGHMVLSTVHTNSAIGAITRLRDMGIEPFLLASTVTAVVAQRLVRRLCGTCKQGYTPTPAELSELDLSAKTSGPYFRAKGCNACQNTGYVGRLGLYEVVSMDDDLRAMIHENASETAMEAHAFTSRETLLQSGARHFQNGLTSSDDVLRVCRGNMVEGA
ncbi:type II secretion system ATPase GspE [Fretibacter rubidus]|uniref:type II secretion system ATPase GspE n=1 Tax=Fretibacter rubidus TaxID=570162 RepID=UPI00352BCDB9